MSGLYFDEEECLGFPVWVAELELLVGNARGKKKVDPRQCFQLLQKLVVTLDRTGRLEVREYQRRCEDALIDILLKGAPPPARKLICEALGKLYSLGDQLPLYSRVSSLQLFLGTKEAFSREQTSEDVRLGALECMASLYYSQGRFLSIGVNETTALAVKYCLKSNDEKTRCAALALLAAAVEGVGATHRNASAVQQDALKTAEKLAKDRDSVAIRLASAGVLRALAHSGGACLWASGLSGYDDARAACLAALEDPSHEVRTAFAQALGDIVVASSSDAATDSVKALERANKPKQKLSQERALGEVVAQCLVTPFVEGSVASNRTICTALAQAWVTYLTAVRGSEAGDAAAFVDRAMRVIDMLGAACSAAGSYQERALVQGEGELGMGIGSGERPHAQACVLYVLRVGVIEQLGEQGQRLLLDKLTAVLAAPLGSHTPVAVVTLEAMALLLEVLGEVSTESGAALQEPIFSKLSGPHQCLRLQAATCLATLTIAEPSSAARHLQTALTQLRQAVTTLVDATTSSAPDRSKPVAPSTPRGVGVAKLKPAMDAVHGWALGTAALLAASVRLPLGVPAALATSALQLAAGLISAPRSQQASAASSEREAGYILLGSLCRSLPSQLLLERQLQLLDLFGPALGQEASTQLESHFGSSSSSLDHLVAAELWWRTSALQALLAYVQGVVLQAPKADQARLCKKVAAFLKPLLDVISSHAALQEPARGKGGPTGMFAGAAALLQLRLLEVYLALPAPNAYILEHEALTKLSMRTVRSVAVAGALPMAESALRPWLDSADTLLGPWPLGQDPLETALLSFEGVAGAPAIQPWEAGLREGLGYAMVEDSEGGGNFQGTTCAPYPQPKALGAALLEAQLSLLGTLLAAVSAPNQAAIVEALLSIAEGGPQKKKDKDPQRRQVAAAIVAAAALAGLRKLQKAGKAAAPPELALRVKALADEVAEESSSSPALQRAAADLYAAAAALAPDNTLAVQLVKALCKEAASTASLSRRATLALAVGSVSSAVGGLSLQAVLPLAVQTLIAVAEASDKSICLWILQALLACANAAGLAFVPHVKPTLGLAQDVLLAEDIYSTPGLLPAIGRLANAMVAVLGPEYSLGSAAYIACKSIMNDMRPGEAGGLWASESPIDEVTAALERVLYTQMLVLFAPKAVPAKSHVQVLVHTLLSRQPRLRKAAADTLRHLAERDAHSVLPEQVEPALFAALDGETDPTIASQLKSTLRTLLVAGAPAEPSRWLALCGDVVMAAAPGTTAMHVSPSKASLESGAGRGDGDDDDEESSAAAAPPPAPAPHAGSAAASPGEGMGSAAVRSSAKAGLTPRLRTRLFAAKCLLQIPGLVCSTDPRHSDLAAAQASGGGDWLVLRLQLLVDMGFKMASGQLEALRPLGVKLMKAAVKRFADTADPLAEGQRLLELYQAQVVSAIRASLSAGASPTLQAAGATLAALFLEEGLAGGDATVLERLMSLLAAPVAQWGSGNQPEQLYAEWVDVRAKVALLEAHAHCAVLAAGSADGATARVVSKAQAPLAEALLDSWLGLLEDYVVLVSQPAAIQLAYRPKLCTASSAATTTATASAAAGTGSAGAPGLGVIPEEGQEAAAGSPAVADGMEQAQGGEQAAAAAPSVQQPGQALSGAPLVAILAAVRRYLQRAWPAALDACTCLLEQQLQEQQQQQQQQPSAPAPLRTARAAERYQALLDICQMCVCDATEPEGASGGAHLAWAAAGSAGAARKGGRGRNGSAAVPGGLQGGLAAALKALERLTGSAFVAVGLLSLEEVAELTALLMALLRQVLAPAASLHHGSSSSSGRNGRQEQSAGGAEAVQRTARVLCQLATAIGSLAGGEGSRAVDPHPLAATALQQLLAAAEECIALAVPGFDPAPAGDSSAALDAHGNGSHPGADSYAALAGVLDPALACAKLTLQAAVGHAASMPDTFVPLLHRSLGLGTALLAAARQAEQLAAGSGYLVDLAAIVGPALQAGSPAGSSMPSPLTVLAGAGASLAQQAQQLTAAGGQAPSARLGATLAAIMPLAGAVAASRPGSSTVAATAPPAAAASGAEDDWGDDAFESAAPSAAAATEAEAQAGGGSEPGEVGATSNADGPGLAATVVANGLEGTSAATEHADATAAGGEASQAEATLQLCLAALQAAAESSDLSVAIAVLQALRGPLQQLSSAQQQPGALQWALRCAAVVLPPAAARVHGLVQGERALGELQVQAVAETLKVALLAATTSSSTGEASQAPFMQLLVPLLIEVAAPLPGNPRPSAVLSDMALKLITHLASGQAAPAFKATVAALPLGAKQRLQQALQGGSGSGGAGGSTAGAQTAAAHAGAAKPSIQLKSFAALKPAS